MNPNEIRVVIRGERGRKYKSILDNPSPRVLEKRRSFVTASVKQYEAAKREKDGSVRIKLHREIVVR